MFGCTDEKDRLKENDIEIKREKEKEKKTWEYRRTREIKREKSERQTARNGNKWQY